MFWEPALAGALFLSSPALSLPVEHETDVEVYNPLLERGALSARVPSIEFEVTPTKSPGWGVIGFYVPVTLGPVTEGPFKLQFDTGSSLIWVISDKLKDEKYDDLQKYPWSAVTGCDRGDDQYNDGTSVKGTLNKNVVVAGKKARKNSFQFLVADEIGGNFDTLFKAGIEGLFGADLGASTFMGGNSFALNWDRNGKSTVTFRGIDTTKGTALDVVNNGGSWLVGSKSLGNTLIDTGASTLILPSSFITFYFRKHNIDAEEPDPDAGTYPWSYDCSKKLPDMSITLDGGTFTIKGSLLEIPQSPGETKCYAALMSAESTKLRVTTMGVPFIESYLLTFDVPGRRVLVQDKPSSSSSSS